MIHSRTYVLSLLAWTFLASLLATPSVSGQDETDSGSYAVYSSVLAHIKPGVKAPHFAIVDETLDTSTLPAPEHSCPDGSPSLHRQIIQIYASPGNQATRQHRLKKEKLATGGSPYELITDADTEQWSQTQFKPHIQTEPATVPDSPLAHLTDLIRFSNVMFNAEHTLAIVYVSRQCGALCGGAGWTILEKAADGSWRVIPNGGCGSIF